jgi:hypothetical protein
MVECRWFSEFTPRLECVVLGIYKSRIVAIYKFYSKLSETHCVNTDAGVADISHARCNYPRLQLILLVLEFIPELPAFPERPPSETEGTFYVTNVRPLNYANLCAKQGRYVRCKEVHVKSMNWYAV